MNKLITAIKDLDLAAVKDLIKQPRWRDWSEPSGKNALHYLCGLRLESDVKKNDVALSILKALLKSGIDIDSPHHIGDPNCDAFPATPLWYAYTKGRNETLYKYLLKHGANPDHCWWAIAWYDDVAAGELWLEHGAKLGEDPKLDDLFLGTFAWKKYAFAGWLLDKDANVNARGPEGLTALTVAVKRKDEDAIKMLMEYGADPNLESEKGLSARKIAATKGPRRILKLLTSDRAQ